MMRFVGNASADSADGFSELWAGGTSLATCSPPKDEGTEHSQDMATAARPSESDQERAKGGDLKADRSRLHTRSRLFTLQSTPQLFRPDGGCFLEFVRLEFSKQTAFLYLLPSLSIVLSPSKYLFLLEVRNGCKRWFDVHRARKPLVVFSTFA
jgi:hypothetical protein